MYKIIIADICSINNKGVSSGHYFSVAENYLEMFPQANVFVAGGPIYNNRFAKHLIALPFDHKRGESSIAEKWHEIKNCCALFKQAKGEIIVMQSVALLTAYIAILLFYHKTSKLYFIQYYTGSINSNLKQLLWRLIKNKVDGIICSSDRVGIAFGIPYIVVTDYIYTKVVADVGLSYNERPYDLCLVGGIFRDKGQVDALRSLANRGLKIVVAGKVNEPGLKEELDEICRLDPTIEMQLGYVSDEDYYGYICKSKYCVLNYRGTYNDRSSGVVLDIIFRGTPVLGHKCGALQLVSDNGLGYIYDDIKSVDFSKVLSIDEFDKYRSNISSYLKLQKKSIVELEKFLRS